VSASLRCRVHVIRRLPDGFHYDAPATGGKRLGCRV
jgi:hypothetical protein